MFKWKQTGFIVAIGVLAFVAGRALPVNGGATAAQPEKKNDKAAQPAQPDMDAVFAKMMEMGAPGDHHKALESMVGEFTGSVKFSMTPDMPPMESKASIKREWAMDGRFVIEHVTGDPAMEGGPAFKGMGIVGYNNWDKKFESVWVENMATHMSSATGSFDAAAKTLTFTGDMIDPMSGKKIKQTSVVDLSNPDREVMTGTIPGPDGKPFKNFEGVFERKK